MKRLPINPLALAAAGWLAAVVAVMAILLVYSASPGPTGKVPERWPAGSGIAFDTSRPNLVLFAHPRCPCTRATLGELEILMAQSKGRLNAQVWFIKTAEAAEDWTDTALWRKAAAIPGVSVHRDEGMAEAARFGAGTSGQTLVYGHDGRLLFHGGITLSRGHSGDNAGRSAALASLDHTLSRGLETPVFGCPLFAAECGEGEVACKP